MWFKIGRELGLSIATLISIKEKNADDGQCLKGMLFEWTKMHSIKVTNPPSTWNDLIKTLSSGRIGFHSTAEKLNEYTKQLQEKITGKYS